MIEKFVEFTPRDIETVKQHEAVFNNVGRLLSKVFTLTITEVKFALQKGQDWPPYRGWLFKFKECRCWYGVSLASQDFLSVRFQVMLEEDKASKLSVLKDQGYQEFSWSEVGGNWLWKVQPSRMLSVSDKDGQIRICTDVLKEHLFAIESVL
jgi:hypothetical protein